MSEPNERLRDSRRRAGYETAAAAARAFGWTMSSYRSHENGTRDLTMDAAQRYGKAFGVRTEWLLWGHHAMQAEPGERLKRLTVPLVGYVGAGAATHFVPPGELGEVSAPDNATETTVAVEIRGESLGSFFDRWLVFYDKVHRPMTPDLIGRLCVIGLSDERVLIKKPQRSRTRGLYHLFSQTEDPILDVEIVWAARVKSLAPR